MVNFSRLCRHLGIPQGTGVAVISDHHTDIGKGKKELVIVWLSSSLDPPCWWHLVQALKGTDYTGVAANIQIKQSKPTSSIICQNVTFSSLLHQVLIFNYKRCCWHHSTVTSNQVWSSWRHLLVWWDPSGLPWLPLYP